MKIQALADDVVIYNLEKIATFKLGEKPLTDSATGLLSKENRVWLVTLRRKFNGFSPDVIAQTFSQAKMMSSTPDHDMHQLIKKGATGLWNLYRTYKEEKKNKFANKLYGIFQRCALSLPRSCSSMNLAQEASKQKIPQKVRKFWHKIKKNITPKRVLFTDELKEKFNKSDQKKRKKAIIALESKSKKTSESSPYRFNTKLIENWLNDSNKDPIQNEDLNDEWEVVEDKQTVWQHEVPVQSKKDPVLRTVSVPNLKRAAPTANYLPPNFHEIMQKRRQALEGTYTG